MRKTVIELLEEKRKASGEITKDFAKRYLGITSQSFHQMKTKGKITRKMVPNVARVLGMSEEEVRLQNKSSPQMFYEELELSSKDLEFLASIVRTSGRAVPVKLLLDLLELKKEKEEAV